MFVFIIIINCGQCLVSAVMLQNNNLVSQTLIDNENETQSKLDFLSDSASIIMHYNYSGNQLAKYPVTNCWVSSDSFDFSIAIICYVFAEECL